MSDERLLSEALRAHAAGGVSTPRVEPSPTTPGQGSGEPGDEPAAGRRRFRPLGRVRRPEQAADQGRPDQARPDQARPDQARPDQARPDQARPDQARPDQARAEQVPVEPVPRPDVPAPRSGALPPPGYARGPMPPAPPTTPVRTGPGPNAVGPGGSAYGYGPPPRPAARPAPTSTPPAGYVPWSAVTVTWWSVVAVLAGGVVGGAIGVLSLLLPG